MANGLGAGQLWRGLKPSSPDGKERGIKGLALRRPSREAAVRSAPSAASGEERARRSEGSGAEQRGQGSRAAEGRRSGAEKAAEVR